MKKKETQKTEAVTEQVAEPVTEPVVEPSPTPVAESPKKLNKALLIIPAIIVVLLILGLVVRTATSSPKSVFTSNINAGYKEASKHLKELDKFLEVFDIKEKAIYLNGNVNLDTNIENLTEEEVKDVKVSFDAGIDVKHEEILVGMSAEGDKETIGEKLYYTDGETYLKTTFLDDIYKVDGTEEGILFELFDLDIEGAEYLFESFEEMKDEIDVDPETYDYLLKTIKNAVNKSLDSKSMKKEKGEFEVDGKKVKATKNSYVFTKSSTKELITKVVDILLKDDKFLEKLSDVTSLDKSDLKDYLKEFKDEVKDNIDFDDEFKINIYTKGLLNKTVGYSFEYDEKEYFTLFTNGKVTEATIDNHDKNNRQKIVATAVKNKKETEVTVKVGKEKVATATVRKFEEKVVDFDATINADDSKIKFSVYMAGEQKKNTVPVEYKFKISRDKEYMEIAGDFTLEATDKLKGFDIDDAKEYDEDEDEDIIEELKGKVERDDKLNAIIGSIIEDYEDANTPVYNYIDMTTLSYSEEVEELFEKNKAKVLYVGSTYYSSYSEADKYELLEALKEAQKTYKFHSYYYAYYYMGNDDYETLGEENKCESTYDCDMFPAIYFIKDGEVKKVLRGKVTAEDIKTALQEIGMA